MSIKGVIIMYDSLKRTCNNGITLANIQIKSNQDKDYYMGIRNAYALILRQIIRNEKYINNKNKIHTRQVVSSNLTVATKTKNSNSYFFLL